MKTYFSANARKINEKYGNGFRKSIVTTAARNQRWKGVRPLKGGPPVIVNVQVADLKHSMFDCESAVSPLMKTLAAGPRDDRKQAKTYRMIGRKPDGRFFTCLTISFFNPYSVSLRTPPLPA